MIQITDKKQCCGCTACVSICPVNCIEMTADNEGFLYPQANADVCIKCGACDRVCPIKKPALKTIKEQWGYIVQNTNERIRKESTSGGFFTALADYVIGQGGVVFGAAYDNDFQVVHKSVKDKDDLKIFRNSKYVQSNAGGVLSEAKKLLDNGTMVLFSGTPCQVEGFKSYLKKDYQNLITMDIVCHAVPSPLIWNKYLEMQKSRHKDIGNILFREKHYGYQYSTMTVRNNKGEDVYFNGIDTDPMLRAFFSNICDRPSCYDCKFKKRYRVSDFTVWDCYPVYKFNKEMDDDKGTSRVLVQSRKGKDIFDVLKNNGSLHVSEASPDALTSGVREMFLSVPENEKRTQFFCDANRLNGEQLFQKYFPITVKTQLEKKTRIFMIKTGIYSRVKRTAKKVLRKD